MKVWYSRVSTSEQNISRQLNDVQGYDYVLSDYCSGLIPLFERPQGRKLRKLIDEGKLKELSIHSIDRLGRSIFQVITVWEELTKKGILITCQNPNIKNFNEDGTIDVFSELLMGIMSVMSSFEKSLIKERQMEGIRIRKEKKLYPGRQISTKDTRERFLQKPKNKKIVEYLKKGTYSYLEIGKILNCSTTTITKVKKVLDNKLLPTI